MLQKYLALQEEHYALKEICTEQERTLEELGGQLSTAKLAAVELREAADNAHQQQNQQQQEGAATWANDRLVTQCKSCNREFNITRRKVIKLFNCPYAFCLDSAISFVSIYSVVVVIVLVVVHWRRRAGIALLKGRARVRLIVQLSLPPWKLPVPRSRFLHGLYLHSLFESLCARTCFRTKLTLSRGFIPDEVTPLLSTFARLDGSKIRIACTSQGELWCMTVLLLEITRCIGLCYGLQLQAAPILVCW